MPSCVLRCCKNNIKKLNKSHGITYHQFPSMGPRRQAWVELVRRERNQQDWAPTKHTRICSAHFRVEDKYMASGNRVYICKTAVPVIDEDIAEEAPKHNIVISPPKPRAIKIEKKSMSFELDPNMELHGRIQQLLIQRMVLTERCNMWKQKYLRLQRRLMQLRQDSSFNGEGSNSRRSSLKWIESEVLGI